MSTQGAEDGFSDARSGKPLNVSRGASAVVLIALFSLTILAVMPIAAAHGASLSTTIPVASGADNIAVNPETDMVYVSGGGSDTITVINGATNSVVGTIALSGYASGIAVDTSTDMIYVANELQASLTVIDGATNTVVDVISLPMTAPAYVAVNANTDTVYVLGHHDQVAVVNAASDTVTCSLTISNIFNVGWIVVNPVTNTIYVAATANYNGQGMLTVISGATDTVSQQTLFGQNGFYVSVDPTTNQVFTTDGSAIYVFNGSTDTQTGMISVSAFAVSVDPTTDTLYATNDQQGGELYVVNGATFAHSETLVTGSFPFDLAVDAETGTVYVANQNGDTVSVIAGSGSTNSAGTSSLVVTSQNLGGQPISGYFTVLYQGDNAVAATGYTSATFALALGQPYVVQVGSYGSCAFSHWADTGSTASSRTIIISGETTLIAVYNCSG
jgi:YVTN family beta-propeller protein